MPYDPGVVNRSGEILARGRLAGGMAALGGISQGFETYQKNKLQNQILSSENEALIAGLQQLQQMKVPGVAQMAPPGMDRLIQKHLEGGGLNLNDSMKLNAMLGTTLKTAKTTQDMQAQAVQRQLQDQALQAQLAELNQAQKDVTGLSRVIKSLASSGEKITNESFLRALSSEQISPKSIKEFATTLGELAPRGIEMTPAQRDTEAIISAEIAAGKLDPNDRQALSQRRSELIALGGRGERQTERFQSPSAIIDANGKYIGQGVFDQKTGEFGLLNPKTGKIEPLPEGAKPSTVSGMSRGMLAGPQFLKLREELGQAEVALSRLSAYMSSVEDSNQGFQRMADRFATVFKTLFDSGTLTPQELARAAATGQLQSLLGANRIEMLGGGVLTENDALRIIAGLGGDVTALQNKEVVRDAIARMYNDKYRTYQRNRSDYNIQVKGGYGEQGYEEADAINFDPRFLKSSASPKAKEDKRTQLKGMMDQIKALEEKLKGKAKD